MATTNTVYKIMQLTEQEYTTLSTTGTLTKVDPDTGETVTYTYSPNDTIYVTPDEYITLADLQTILADYLTSSDASSTYLTQTDASSTYQPKFIRLDNQTILTADWTSDSATHTGYSYKKTFNITGVTNSSTVNVYPNLATVEAGNLMPVADLGAGTVTIFSKTDDEAVIERIEVIN